MEDKPQVPTPDDAPKDPPRQLILLLDGTTNTTSETQTNVAKLKHILSRHTNEEKQVSQYFWGPGVETPEESRHTNRIVAAAEGIVNPLTDSMWAW
jgi:uncharacterized protein (DUF2235 family)